MFKLFKNKRKQEEERVRQEHRDSFYRDDSSDNSDSSVECPAPTGNAKHQKPWAGSSDKPAARAAPVRVASAGSTTLQAEAVEAVGAVLVTSTAGAADAFRAEVSVVSSVAPTAQATIWQPPTSSATSTASVSVATACAVTPTSNPTPRSRSSTSSSASSSVSSVTARATPQGEALAQGRAEASTQRNARTATATAAPTTAAATSRSSVAAGPKRAVSPPKQQQQQQKSQSQAKFSATSATSSSTDSNASLARSSASATTPTGGTNGGANTHTVRLKATTGPPKPAVVVDQALVLQLTGMGFSKDASNFALRLAKNHLDLAANFLLERSEEEVNRLMEVDTQKAAQSAKVAVGKQTKEAEKNISTPAQSSAAKVAEVPVTKPSANQAVSATPPPVVSQTPTSFASSTSAATSASTCASDATSMGVPQQRIPYDPESLNQLLGMGFSLKMATFALRKAKNHLGAAANFLLERPEEEVAKMMADEEDSTSTSVASAASSTSVPAAPTSIAAAVVTAASSTSVPTAPRSVAATIVTAESSSSVPAAVVVISPPASNDGGTKTGGVPVENVDIAEECDADHDNDIDQISSSHHNNNNNEEEAESLPSAPPAEVESFETTPPSPPFADAAVSSNGSVDNDAEDRVTQENLNSAADTAMDAMPTQTPTSAVSESVDDFTPSVTAVSVSVESVPAVAVETESSASISLGEQNPSLESRSGTMEESPTCEAEITPVETRVNTASIPSSGDHVDADNDAGADSSVEIAVSGDSPVAEDSPGAIDLPLISETEPIAVPKEKLSRSDGEGERDMGCGGSGGCRPPVLESAEDRPVCAVCEEAFSANITSQHCHNCGRRVCVDCSDECWPQSMLPESFHLHDPKQACHRSCDTCQTQMEKLVRDLRAGDLKAVQSACETSHVEVHLHTPFSIYPDCPYAIHCAAASGNVELMRWLVGEKLCSLYQASAAALGVDSHDGDNDHDHDHKVPLINAAGDSVLSIAGSRQDANMLRYLIAEAQCRTTDLTDVTVLQRALQAAFQ